MAEYTVSVQWQRKDEVFTDNRYSRGHVWQFDGGVQIPASSSPHVVPLPFSVAEAVDPEEAFVAALSSATCCGFFQLPPSAGLSSKATGTRHWA
jgi:organic hydroperoxide reductase OsmC/OhrA